MLLILEKNPNESISLNNFSKMCLKPVLDECFSELQLVFSL